ncbi:MAG TPA: FAD-dependent oxidoreductase [Roseiflexaceae bacterium]|nr:FAD-dependent oxidoreductase [Roseiflexaceae bacterium]
MASVQKVLIVGGGISGLIGALALRQRGIAVEIVELNPRWDVYGVGIITMANSLRALRSVGLAERVLEAGHAMGALRFFDSEGRLLYEVPQPQLAGPDYPPSCALTRPRLHAILQEAIQAAGVRVRLGLSVAEIAQREALVEVAFTDGTTGSYDLLIGADGLRSTVRSLVFGPEHQPVFTGQMVWRCNVPRPPEVDTLQIFQGPGGNKTGFVPLAPDLMYIFLTETPRPGAETRIPQERLAEALRERLAEFGGPVAVVRDNHITDPALVVYRPFERILLPPPWHRGRVVLTGDAAHAMSAHIAQGAGMAIEDAVVLAAELGDKPTVEQALQGYTARRYERCKAIVEIATELGRAEMENDRSVNVAALTARAMQIVAEPI